MSGVKLRLVPLRPLLRLRNRIVRCRDDEGVLEEVGVTGNEVLLR
jgi:hypothetical protein